MKARLQQSYIHINPVKIASNKIPGELNYQVFQNFDRSQYIHNIQGK
jgi:hypothetical protein